MAEKTKLPVPIKYTGMICFFYGLQIFRCSTRCHTISSILSKCYYMGIIAGFLHALRMIFIPKLTENGIVLGIFLIGALGVYVFLRRNISKIERVLYMVEGYLTEKDLILIRKTDKWINMMHYLILTVSLVLAVFYFACSRDDLRLQFQTAGLDHVSDTMILVIIISAYVYHMKVLYGIISCSILLYTITMVVFECMSQNLKSIIKQIVAEKATVQSITQIRTQLRIYWNWKQKADKFLNIFPFIWAAYVFLTVSLIMTKLIFEWHTTHVRHAFLMISTFFCTLLTVDLMIKWHLFTAPDKTMDKCMRLIFSLTDPRKNGNQVTLDPKLHQEILSLHLEIANAPTTYSTILGAIRLNFKTLISYVGALVNFAVMIISIRMAVKAQSE